MRQLNVNDFSNKPRAQFNDTLFQWSKEDELLLELMQGNSPKETYLQLEETTTGDRLVSVADKQGWSCVVRILLLLEDYISSGHDLKAPLEISSEDDLLLGLVLAPNLESLEQCAHEPTGQNVFHIAASTGSSCAVRMLLLLGADFRTFDKRGENSLAKAVFSRSTDIVNKMLEAGADIDSPASEDGETMLHLAVYDKDSDMIEFLLRNRADFMTFDKNRENSLAKAVLSRSTGIVKRMLEAGARIDSPATSDGQTMLHLAAYNKSQDMIEFLVGNKADFWICDGIGENSLAKVIHSRCTSIIDKMLKQGVDIDSAATSDGMTMLHLAVRYNYPEMIKFLVMEGANLFARTENQLTPIAFADDRTHCEWLETAIAHSLKNDKGETDVIVCAAYGKRLTLVEWLLDFGVDVNTRASHGTTALHKAAEESASKIVKLLLEMGADVNAQDHDGNTALHMFDSWVDCSTAKDNITEMLLNAGADNKLQNKSGDTALHIVCRYGESPLDAHLNRFNGNINIENFHGQTPLHVAAGYGYAEHMKELLKRGADRTLRDNKGQTPPDITDYDLVPREFWTSN